MSAPLVDWQNVGGRLSFDAVSLAFLVGLSAFFGHVFFTRGYRGVSVAHATLLSLLVPVVAALAGIWLLEEEFSARFIAGALIILTALSFVLTGRSASGTGDSASE
jgi:drug/metabolite transporter (DMT)-like permease